MSFTKFKLSWPDKTALSKGAFAILKKLRKTGFEAFLAGGAVRDALLKRPIHEIDIATSAKPEEVKKLFKKTIPTGEKHGTVTVFPLPSPPHKGEGINKKKFLPPSGGGKERGYEVTTFRVEGPYEKHRRPSKVRFVSTAEEDAKRRDFTVNALFYDQKAKAVIDYVNGIADLSHRRIRFIGQSEDRIREDALRLLRAVRFSTTLGLALARETQRAIVKNARLIQKISAERIKQELDLIMLSDRPSVGLGLLDIVGLLEFILPEIKNLQGVRQPRNQHAEGDVYAHTLLAIEQFDESYDLATRYAVLFHDIGKPQTAMVRSGKITFYDHTKVGSELAGKICKRLKFSTADTQKIAWLVANHLVPNDFADMRLGTRRKWGLNSNFPALLKLYLADVRASLHPSGKADRNPRGYREGLKILKEIKSQPALRKPLISGRDVMRILRIPEGPEVGKVLREIEEKKLSGELITKADALQFLQAKKNI